MWLVIIVLAFFVYHFKKKSDNYENRLRNVTYLDFKTDSLLVKNGLDISSDILFITPDYVESFNNYHSPFGDGKQFKDLVEKYVKIRSQDLYGSPRRTGEWRRIHSGIDLFVPENTPLYPLMNYGIVTEVSDNPNHLIPSPCEKDGVKGLVDVEYGKIVKILYPDGIESLYAHLNEVNVEVGQAVNLKTRVGITGYTGNIKGSGKASHLHLELRDKDNNTFDPLERLYFDKASYNNFLGKLNLQSGESEK